MDLKNNFNSDIAKKIFGNQDNMKKFLLEVKKIKNLILFISWSPL